MNNIQCQTKIKKCAILCQLIMKKPIGLIPCHGEESFVYSRCYNYTKKRIAKSSCIRFCSCPYCLHSSLLMQLLRQYPNLHVYAYGPLPCLDFIAAEACSNFVTR